MSRRVLFLALFAACCYGRFALRDGERILFLGDSITQGGAYVEDIEAFLLTRFPERHFDVIKLGLSSETVTGLSEPGHPFPRPNVHFRLDKALAKTRPGVVVACYGMNDGIYHPFSEDRFAAYQQGIRRLVVKVRAAGARVVLLTPPPFDGLPKTAVLTDAPPFGYKTPYRDYDRVLERYGQWLLTLRGPGVEVIDIHTPMARYAAERRRTEPRFTLSRDGIHPGAEGHWLMAETVLAAWGAPAVVEVLRPGTHRSRIPLPMASRLNRYVLKVAASGTLYEGGTRLGEVKAPEADLLAFPMLSTNRRGAEVLRLVQRKWRVLGPAWLAEVGHTHPSPPKALPFAEARRQAGELEQAARRAAAPVEITLRVARK